MGYRELILATPGLRTYHQMSGGASEASIGPDTATMTHTGSPVAAASLVAGGNGALQYSGTAMESSFSTSSFDSATAMSLEFWFREDSLVDWTSFLGNDDWPTCRFGVSRRAAETNLITGWRDGVAGVDFGTTGPYNQLAINYVAMTIGAGTVRLYVNGIERGSLAATGSFGTGARTFKATKAGSSQLAGVLDECATYNVELSAATVAQHHKVGRSSGVLKGLMLPV